MIIPSRANPDYEVEIFRTERSYETDYNVVYTAIYRKCWPCLDGIYESPRYVHTQLYRAEVIGYLVQFVDPETLNYIKEKLDFI